ncbi:MULTISPECIES: hypothetical protein [Pontibacillus]|uniref:DUF4282 domain-containing protein n=1 Tax=Pontibacillus chungwhensis TaxID=265426 RepID=A0ABY8UWM6_9BACI|nr:MULTISPECIES: hypothetical protein [Pontibacillus]MCD5324197.1 hypothetical protein [Pontibacillus sp. HN14]WIF97745.1 hypothetical protein QNI29_18780 [Pontibacillus chungwhensis]
MDKGNMIKTALLGSTSSHKLDSYPVLKIIKAVFTYLSLAVLVIGTLAALVNLFTGKFLLFLVTLIVTFIGWGTIKIYAEFIQLAVDIADNTRRTAEVVERQRVS